MKVSEMTNLELEFRRYMWLNHGHQGLYGDDGQMQCGQCPLDFLKQPLEQIQKKLFENDLRRLNAEPGKPRCPKCGESTVNSCGKNFPVPEFYPTPEPNIVCDSCGSHWMPKNMADFAQFLPAERQEGWVSVKERLPSQDVKFSSGKGEHWTSSTWVLCVEWDGNREEYRHVIASYSDTKGWSALGYIMAPHITYWRPLPAPPSAPSGEKEKA